MSKKIIRFILVGILLATLLMYRKRNMDNNEIVKNRGVPALGTVTESSPPAFYGGAHTNFKFYTKSNQRIFIFGFKRPHNKIKKGDRFLVLYLPEKPKTAIMLFDYPIKDSADFKRYVKKFEQMRKEKKKE